MLYAVPGEGGKCSGEVLRECFLGVQCSVLWEVQVLGIKPFFSRETFDLHSGVLL